MSTTTVDGTKFVSDNLLEEIQGLFGFCYAPEPRRTPRRRSFNMSLDEVGEELGISGEMVRRIERLALVKAERFLHRNYPHLRLDDILG